MTRIVLAVFLVYAVLLAMFMVLRQSQLTASIHNRIADATISLIDKYPFAFRQTKSSEMEILRERVIQTSPYNINNWTRTDPAHELVTMSPCNPRIRRCG